MEKFNPCPLTPAIFHFPPMRTLLLMRHAKSSWADDAVPDEERPLNARGKTAATQMGRFLRDHSLSPDLILTSPAKRARQTAKLVKVSGDFGAPIVQNPLLYFTGPTPYLDCIGSAPDTVATLLLIGHNPDLETLVSRIAGKYERMPTAAIARIHLDSVTWRGLRDAAAWTLFAIYRPKELTSSG